jgi:hypothetical protein
MDGKPKRKLGLRVKDSGRDVYKIVGQGWTMGYAGGRRGATRSMSSKHTLPLTLPCGMEVVRQAQNQDVLEGFSLLFFLNVQKCTATQMAAAPLGHIRLK